MEIDDLSEEEYNKCKANPYYFATKYVTVNSKPFATNMNEEEFNTFARQFNVLPLEPEHCGVRVKVIPEYCECVYPVHDNSVHPVLCKLCSRVINNIG